MGYAEDAFREVLKLKDRLAKLEARLDFSVRQGAWSLAAYNVEPATTNQVVSPTEPHAALRDYLAQDKSLDELMPSPWQVEPPAAAGPIPPGWTAYAPGRFDCGACGAEVLTVDGNLAYAAPGADKYVCRSCAVERGAIVKVEQPAEQPAAGMKCGACGEGRHADCSGWCFCRDCQPAEQPAGAAHVCQVCDFTFTENGCRPGDCSYRPRPGTPEALRIERRREELGADRLYPAPAQAAPAEPLACAEKIASLAGLLADAQERIAEVTRDRDLEKRLRKDARDYTGELEARLAAAETDKATLSTHCVRAERVAQERKEALSAAERERDELRREFEEHEEQRHEVIDKLCLTERERDEAAVSVKQAVAAERERCVFYIQSKRTMLEILEAIGSGEPAPK